MKYGVTTFSSHQSHPVVWCWIQLLVQPPEMRAASARSAATFSFASCQVAGLILWVLLTYAYGFKPAQGMMAQGLSGHRVSPCNPAARTNTDYRLGSGACSLPRLRLITETRRWVRGGSGGVTPSDAASCRWRLLWMHKSLTRRSNSRSSLASFSCCWMPSAQGLNRGEMGSCASNARMRSGHIVVPCTMSTVNNVCVPSRVMAA